MLVSFPKRYRAAHCPDYPAADFRLLANPTGALYTALIEGHLGTEESAAALGAALSEAYGGGKVEAYEVVFDFSTAAGAVSTLRNEAIPIDLRAWLRNAPIDLVGYEREESAKNFAASLTPGS